MGRDIGWIKPAIILILWTLASVGLACLLAMSRAHAHDPVNHANNSWLKDLMVGAVVCCNGDDVIDGPDWEYRDGRYIVLLGGRWQVVPEHAVIDPHKNRDGVARVWPTKSLGLGLTVRCFMPGSQT